MSHWSLDGTRAERYSVGDAPVTKPAGSSNILDSLRSTVLNVSAAIFPHSFWMLLGMDMHGTTRSMLEGRIADPKLQFHAGELAIQEKRGSRESAYNMVVLGGFVEKHLDTDIQRFFLGVQFMVISHLEPESGLVWTSLANTLSGKHVAVTASSLTIDATAFAAADDPILRLLATGAEVQVGVIAMEPELRQRHRLSGIATLQPGSGGAGGEGVMAIQIVSAWFNCPKYIHIRKVAPPSPLEGGTPVVTREARALTADEKQLVTTSDTLYIGSAEPTAGADASHRGGRPGFCRVSEVADAKGKVQTTVCYGEYNGNGTNMTLGNIYAYPKACLLFIDHASGFVLQLSGAASVEFPQAKAEQLDGGDCYVKLVVEEVCRIERASVVSCEDVDGHGESPYNPPLSGPGLHKEAVKARTGGDPSTTSPATEGAEYALARSEAACADGSTRTFFFEPSAGSEGHPVVARMKAHRAGQFVTLVYPSLDSALRSYTIASAPAYSQATGGFYISVKLKPEGLVSTWLHQTAAGAAASFSVRVLGVDGGPMLLAPQETNVLMISAGVGITPMLAHLRAFRDGKSEGQTVPRITLLHCDRLATQTVCRGELDALVEAGVIAKMVLVETKGEERRRIARAHLANALGILQAPPTVLLCGPEQFVYAVKRCLIDDLNLDPGLICFDDFTF